MNHTRNLIVVSLLATSIAAPAAADCTRAGDELRAGVRMALRKDVGGLLDAVVRFATVESCDRPAPPDEAAKAQAPAAEAA
ncbi:hypothetical protein [Jeongeupia chitinilytica]|uniref:UrcA family protein n=1 Tax=Jeongeupia chitinilytica TaxID=1041641 RepID=A0ABQ3GZB5_9NEIS|nr:hypothetical protein [Jeongeupia chitinilytica]GHD59773.1 hypothetical protein GCM10007350_11490 [Jeongeupia chitinilytica]